MPIKTIKIRFAISIIRSADVLAIVLFSLCPSQLAFAGSIVGWGSHVVGVDLSGGFIKVAAGYNHSLGLKHDGSIVAWGSNWNGECNVPLLNTGFIDVAAGGDHSLGLKQDGAIVSWGANGSGQCNVPLPNTGFVSIDAGGYHSLVLIQA